MSARDQLFELACQDMPVTSDEVNEAIDAYVRQLADGIQDAMEETRAADWGKSSRSKRPYLQGMERARKTLLKEKADG